MKTLRVVVLLSLAVVLLAGCGGLPPVFPTRAPAEEAAPAAPVEPAVVAPAEPAPVPAPTEAAAAPAAEAPAEPVMGADPLVGIVWQWAAYLKTEPASQSVVPNPSSYTAIFDGKGTVLIQADCNLARATYTLENEALAIEVGPMTRAACTPGSFSNEFLDRLGEVGSYMIDGDDLILRLGETGDSMLFRNGGPPTEPVAAPELAAVATEAPAGAAAAEAVPELAGTTWNWEEFVDNAGVQSLKVADPASYTVTFQADGTVAMKADCNQAAGSYVLEGANLAVTVGPMTLAMCAAESLSEQFLVNLTSVATVGAKDGKLLLDLMADGGTMIFVPAQ